MNKLLSGLILTSTLFTLNAYSASIPADAFSRANCRAYIPFLGYGWYNESISFDLFTGKHQMKVSTHQEATNKDGVRSTNSGDVRGLSARAGYVDNVSNSTVWLVKGYHKETLDNGRRTYANSTAKDCNLRLGQFL